MKKLLTTTALLVALSSTAFAGNEQGQLQGQIGINKSSFKATNKNSNANFNASKSFSDSNAKSKSKATAIQGQDASNSVDVGGDSYSYKEVRQTQSAIAPTVIATSDCLGSASGAAQSGILGLAFGFSTNSDNCNNREDAKLFMAYGEKEDALLLLRSSLRYKKAVKIKEIKDNRDSYKPSRSEYPSHSGYHMAK